jgi:hypothetical protein
VRRIYAGLAADRRVHLSKQACRNLQEPHAAADRRRRKPGEIADNAAAKRNDNIAAFHPRGEDRIADVFVSRKALR